VKYLKLYENYNPDRISDEKYRIYSTMLRLGKGTSFDNNDNNLFYISDVTSFMPESGNQVDCPEVIIEFYSPDLSFLDKKGDSTKSLQITFVIDYEEYLYLQNAEYRLLSLFGSVNDRVVDVYFPEETLNEILNFLKEDYPEAYKILNGITYNSVCKVHKKLLNRI
jgi:hypothetical protein